MADFTTSKSYNYYWQSAKFKDLVFSGSLISQFVNDKGYVTSSVAISASYALTASYVKNAISASYFSGSVSNAISASYATTASYVLNAVSASYATTASYAATSSYAMNGGVTQLLAGPNVTLSPTNGLGQVTVSATLSGSTSFNTATGSYGSFYSTQTQTNVAGTARSMSLNTTDITNGVSISGSTNPFNTYIKTQNAGIYNIQFSAQVDKTDSGTDEIWIWIRKNGTNLTDTATSIQLVGNGAHYVASWNFFVNAAADDYFQLMWYSPDANVRLHAEPAFGVVPGIPSLIVTANRIDQFLSNTGSFSGSFTGGFTGSLQGTASFATSASWAPDTTFPYTGSALITGSLGITGSASITGTTTTNLVRITQTGTGNAFVVEDDTTPDSSPFIIDNIGRVGIGKTFPSASLDITGRAIISSSQNTISGSSLTVFGSGSTLPVFTVQGSQGELFSINDSLSGSLFKVNDITGTPILEVFSDNTTLMGSFQDPMLITTSKTVQTNSGSFIVYSLPTASYDTAFFEYSIRSGSNARAGTIMAIQSGSAVNFTETTTTDFGSTSAVSFTVIVTGSNMALTGSSTLGSWTTKCIVRGI
jgi:hypothetical protein